MHWLGIDWVGVNATNGRKLALSIGFILCVFALRSVLGLVLKLVVRGSDQAVRARFWTQQGLNLLTAVLLMLGFASIWFDNPERLSTAFGLVSAGVAIALQRVITALAGYFVILRGNNFSIGDRISMGGVRGDVIALGFIQTTIMEMGEPASVQETGAGTWVRSRQFTGRIVTVSNSQIFDEPVFNYTRDFPFIWDEILLPVAYSDDRARAEEVLLEAARKHAITPGSLDPEDLRHLEEKYHVAAPDIEPRVFWRLTDNWLELTVRYLTGPHRTRITKDAMSRQILSELDSAGIGIASSTYDVVGFPPVEIKNLPALASALARPAPPQG